MSSLTKLPASRPAVLLVEDDILVADLAAGALESAGYDLISVTAAEDALGLAVMDTDFDILVTDINLAGEVDGWELAQDLREMRPDLPVIYASGSAGEGDGRAVPGAAFMPKPYNPIALAAAVRDFIGPGGERPRAVPAPRPFHQPPMLRLIA